MEGYWERWEKEGSVWKEIFKTLDPWLAGFAEQYGMELTKEHWDAPDRVLTWIADDGLHKNIHVYIEDKPNSYEIAVEANVWEDIYGPNARGERHYLRIEPKKFSTPPANEKERAEYMIKVFIFNFTEVYEQLSSIKREHLKDISYLPGRVSL